MFKLQISFIFNFDHAHQSWISGVLGVNRDLRVGVEVIHFFCFRVEKSANLGLTVEQLVEQNQYWNYDQHWVEKSRVEKSRVEKSRVE